MTQDGVAREHVDVPQLGRHRLDHDFLGVEHAVHHDAEGLVADLRHHDEAVLRIGRRAVIDLQELLQMHQRQELVAQAQDGGVLDALDAMLGIGARAHQLDHRQFRDREAVAAGFHDQRRDDGERQRDLDGDRGALAGHRFDIDGAADLIDIGAHHIHADAAARDRGDGGGRREARLEDEFVDLRFRHLLELGLGDETVRDRLGLDALGVETAAIVGDADDDVAAFMIGGETDRALLGLAARGALGRRLQAMIGGVAHHVGERVLDQVEHLAVELGVGAVHLELDLLAEFGREVADDARQLLPGIADRLHARLHDALLQFGGDVGQPLQRHLEFGVLVAAGDLQELIARQHQLGDHRHQMFERVDIDADRLVGDLVVLMHLAIGIGLGSRRLFRGFGFGLRLCLDLGRLGLRRGRGRFGLRRLLMRGRRLDRSLAEGALQLVERHLARTQRTLQGLVDQGALRHRGRGRRCCGRGRHQRRRSLAGGHRGHAALDHRLELADQIAVFAFRLGLIGLELRQQVLDAVDGGEDQRHGLAGHRHAITEFAHQGLGGVRQRFEPRQAEEAAGPLDRVHQAEDVIEDLGVVRLLLEPHQLIVDGVQALAGLRQKLTQQVIHETGLPRIGAAIAGRPLIVSSTVDPEPPPCSSASNPAVGWLGSTDFPPCHR